MARLQAKLDEPTAVAVFAKTGGVDGSESKAQTTIESCVELCIDARSPSASTGFARNRLIQNRRRSHLRIVFHPRCFRALCGLSCVAVSTAKAPRLKR